MTLIRHWVSNVFIDGNQTEMSKDKMKTNSRKTNFEELGCRRLVLLTGVFLTYAVYYAGESMKSCFSYEQCLFVVLILFRWIVYRRYDIKLPLLHWKHTHSLFSIPPPSNLHTLSQTPRFSSVSSTIGFFFSLIHFLALIRCTDMANSDVLKF